jgi:hypothetical protein
VFLNKNHIKISAKTFGFFETGENLDIGDFFMKTFGMLNRLRHADSAFFGGLGDIARLL